MAATPGPRSGRFDALGLPLNYLEWGDPHAPPLLMIHGGLDNAWSWAELAAVLRADWRVVALDLRGHGDSGWSMGGDYHTHSFLGDMAAFAAAMFKGPVPIVAHSMGARLSLYLAGAVPEAVARLVAIEGLGRRRLPPEGTQDTKMRAWLEARAQRQAAGHVQQVGHWLRSRARYRRKQPRPYASLEEAAARLQQGDEKLLRPDQALEFARTGMRTLADGRLAWKFDPVVRWHIGEEAREPEPHSYYAQIQCPVLHVYGALSLNYPPPETDLACFQDARLATIEGAGHWVHFNRLDAVVAEIRPFLAGAEGRP